MMAPELNLNQEPVQQNLMDCFKEEISGFLSLFLLKLRKSFFFSWLYGKKIYGTALLDFFPFP